MKEYDITIRETLEMTVTVEAESREEARGYDTGDPFYDVKVGGTRYSERMPLGTAEEIKSMTAEKLENFYRKWYVPELATIVVVGDLNVGEMEGKIKEVFGGVPAVKTTGYKEYPLEYTEKVAYQEMQDTLITRSALELIFLLFSSSRYILS